MTTHLSRIAARSAGALILLASPLLALAQPEAPGAPVPPTPAKPDDPPAIMSFLIMLAIAALIVGANAVATKRGHQD